MTADVVLRPVAGSSEYPDLVAVWRSAVLATHHFLAHDDFAAIEVAMPVHYLPAVELLVAERDGAVVGFSGIAGGRLEMLFVDDAARGSGVGSALLADAVRRFPELELDVNEQNPSAVGFYLAKGFRQVSRTDVDGDGRPYPLLTLRRAG